MTKIIKGAKAGMPEQHTPSIAKDSVASKSKIKILYGLSEGEVKGLANGAASIMLDGTPLLDSDGNANFEGVTWEVRNGTVDQSHIEGLPNVSNENNISTILRFGTPWIYNLTDTQLSSVNVNVSWARLSEMTDKMDVVGTRVDYTIEVQTDGYGYQTVLTAFVQDKTSGRYQRTHNIKLPKAKNGWQIRIKKLTTDGDNEKIFNQMSIDSIAEIIDVKLRYPCTALLYLSYDAKTFGNVPKLSVDLMGRYVQVPSNYDPVTRTSAGLWDGTFKQAYTDNPAWHYYDLITNDRYGLGQRLKPFMISKWALQRIAAICDTMVDDGKGGTEPRYTCNLYLQTAEDAFSVLQHLAGIFRGLSFWDGSQITIEADTYRDTDYTITRANVVNGEFIKTGSSWSNRHTVAKVAWSNPANAYETEYVMVRSEQAIAKFGINILDLPAVGCTSEGQAYRMGLSALLTEQRRNQTVSFAMGLDGALPSVGDRIDIADPMFAGHNNGGRIASVSADFKVITLDRDVTAKIGDKLTGNLDAGKAQSRKITAIDGRNITVDTAFDAVSAQNVWSIASDTLPTMPFTVMSVTANDDGTQYNYTALQYDATLYDSIDKGVIIEAPSVNSVSINPRQINAPATVTIAPRYRVEQGQSITTLVITWDQVKEAAEYEVEWRRDNDSWKVLDRTTNISAEVDGVYAGQYQARVKAISAFEISSNTTYSDTVTIAAKLTNPSGVLTLKAYGLLFAMRIDWTFPSNSSDTAYTEIEVAKAPEVNVSTLGTFSYPTNTAVMQGLEGNLTLYFRARLVDKLGFKSNWSDWTYGTTDANAQKVLDLLSGQITESQLYKDLGTKIEQIQVNTDAITKETKSRIAAIKSVADGLTQEIIDRQNGDTNTLEVINTYKVSNDNAMAAVQADINAVTTAQSATASKLDGVYAVVTPLTADSNSWTADSGSKQATAWTLQSAIVDGDSALSSRIDTYVAQTDSSIATIKQDVNAVTTAQSATASKLDGVYAIVTPLTADSNSWTADSGSKQATAWTLQSAIVDGDRVISERIDTVQTTVEGNTSSIQTQQQSIYGLYGQYFVKLDVNGRVSGFGTANDGVVSDFAVRADKFYIAPPDGIGKGDAPFVVTTTPQVIDGVTIPAGTYIKAAYIAKASIDTLHIKGNAVTVPVSAFTGDTISVGSSYTTIQSLYVPAAMGHTMLTFNAVFNFGGFDAAQQLLCRIVKGDQVIVNDLEVFYNESDAQEIVTGHAGSHTHGVSTSFSGSTSNTGSHTHGGSVSLNGSTGSAFVGTSSHSHSIGGNSSFNTSSSGDHSHSVSGSVSVSVQSDAGHSHTMRSTNKSRNAGTIAVSRHDSSEVDGVYYLQIKVARGSAVNLSNRYIHAITMRR